MTHSATSTQSAVEAVRWVGDAATGHLELLDQRLLPIEETYVRCSTAEATTRAIRDMIVRGAPAIGVAAAFGVVLAAQELGDAVTDSAMAPVLDELIEARPTAVNLRWAVARMRALLGPSPNPDALTQLFEEAARIREEDIEANIRMGRMGAELLPDRARVMTYCNTGSLATAGHGTALGVIRSGWAQDRIAHVYACETRPYLQGARLTMWELQKEEIDATLITDNMAGFLMSTGAVDAVIVGADRIAANGDTANKIGTYSLAILARHHGIPFYVAAPRSTVDLDTPSGDEIPIEERSVEEVTQISGAQIAPLGVNARHPAFDVTPAELITAIILDNAVCEGDYVAALIAALADG